MLPLLVFSAVVLAKYAGSREDAAQQHILSFSRVVALAVDGAIGRGLDAVDGLAHSPALAHDNLPWFLTRCHQAVANMGTGSWVMLLDAHERPILATSTAAKPLLNAVRPYLAQAAQTEHTVLSNYLDLPSEVGHYVAIVAPVRHAETGAIVRYIVLGLDLDIISRMLDKIEPPDDWLVAIIDKSQKIVGRSDDPLHAWGHRAHPDFLQQVAGRSAGLIESRTYDSQMDTVGAFTRMPRTGWVASVGLQRDAFYQPTRNALMMALFGGAGLTIIGLVMALWMSRRVAGPMNDLVKAARDVGEGRRTCMRRALRLVETREVAKVLRASARRIGKETAERERVVGELQALTASLEQRVAARTLEVEQAWHIAENANQGKSDFLTRVSHEIRTPLTGILAHVDLMLAAELTEHQRERLTMLRRTCVSLKRLLSDILDFAKIEANRLELEAIPFSPQMVVTDAVKLTEGIATDKSILITIDTDGLPARVVGDSHRLRQVLTNLLTNAVTHTKEGTIKVTARALEAGRTLEFAVQDTGVGLSDEVKKQLFEPFPLGTPSAARRHGGIGLGLAICKQLVAAMGGSITAEGALGKGSRFTFSVAVRPLGTMPTEGDMQAGGQQPVLAGRVLVAEDNPTNRPLIVEFLERMGHLVDSVENGAQAVEAIRREKYDVVVMDVQMPVLDGIDAAMRIRGMDEEKARTHIIALSADSAALARRTSPSPFDEYEPKPIDWTQLCQKIQRGIAQQLSKEGVEVPVLVEPLLESVQDIPLLDTAVLERLRDKLGDERLAKLIATLPTNMTGQLQQATHAFERGDNASAEAAAHGLQGTAALIGLPQLAAASRRMQQAPNQQVLVALQNCLTQSIKEARGWSARHLTSANTPLKLAAAQDALQPNRVETSRVAIAGTSDIGPSVPSRRETQR
jgi:signal transduction histidine kinase/DNA-binding NarL/FixJ family response regulator